ncbi:MAG: toll/interleukin-1 receptor domain-containing protein [Niastella sp.]|nr:toll/interleukin-1 receptor domain-containing protein [Niastella sp.]
MTPTSIFISYSHKDESLMEELFEFLQPLVFAKRIKLWNDKAIAVGDPWDETIKKALEGSDIILFLLSPSFLASTYINSVEIARAFELRKQGRKLIPVMLRPCDIDSHIVPDQQYKVSDFQGLPKNMLPIVKWETHEDGWIDVVRGIKSILPK